MSQNERDLEIFKNLHDLQYNRVAQLESQKNYITTFVTGLSALTIAYSFNNTELSFVNGFILPSIYISANLIAAKFLKKTRAFIKTHQKRAELMREKYVPELKEIWENSDKIDSNKDKYNRTQYMCLLHYLIAGIAAILIIQFLIRLISLL